MTAEASQPTFRDFAGAVMQGDIPAAGALLQTLLGTDAAQSRAAAEHFQRSITSDPSFAQKAMGMRQVVSAGSREELKALLADCFQLDEPASLAATDAVWTRFRSA
jgi:hypothetical protein